MNRDFEQPADIIACLRCGQGELLPWDLTNSDTITRFLEWQNKKHTSHNPSHSKTKNRKNISGYLTPPNLLWALKPSPHLSLFPLVLLSLSFPHLPLKQHMQALPLTTNIHNLNKHHILDLDYSCLHNPCVGRQCDPISPPFLLSPHSPSSHTKPCLHAIQHIRKLWAVQKLLSTRITS